MVRQRGISLAEVTISVAILFMIITAAVPHFRRSDLKAREAVLKQQLATVRDAYDRCFADTGVYPSPEWLWRADSPGGGWVPTRQGEGWAYINFDNSLWRGPYLINPLGPPPIPGGSTSGATGLGNGWSWNSTPSYAVHAFFLNHPGISTEGTPYHSW